MWHGGIWQRTFFEKAWYVYHSHTHFLCHSDRAKKGEWSESPKPQEAVLAHMFAQTLSCVNVTFPCATKEFGVYNPPRALCCALGDPLDGALLRRFGMTHSAVRRVTTDRRGRRSLQESNIPHVRRTNVGLFGMFAHEFFVSFRPSQQRLRGANLQNRKKRFWRTCSHKPKPSPAGYLLTRANLFRHLKGKHLGAQRAALNAGGGTVR